MNTITTNNNNMLKKKKFKFYKLSSFSVSETRREME